MGNQQKHKNSENFSVYNLQIGKNDAEKQCGKKYDIDASTHTQMHTHTHTLTHTPLNHCVCNRAKFWKYVKSIQ